jgi:hypothetical protein
MAEDPSAVETLAGDLERRLRADYRVAGETSARLGALREPAGQVALIIRCESMRAMPDSGLLARSRSTHPDAEWIVLIGYQETRASATPRYCDKRTHGPLRRSQGAWTRRSGDRTPPRKGLVVLVGPPHEPTPGA